VDPSSTTNDNVIQKGITFMIPNQRAVTDIQTVTPVLFHELSWNRPCTNFKEVKSAEDDLIGRAMAIRIFFPFGVERNRVPHY
jgi:hypothetical protein